MRYFAVAGMLLILIGNARGVEKVPVNLELVLAIDTSLSVDDQEFELQRQGLANAFLHRDVVNAILAHSEGGIAVTIIHWAGENKQQTVVDWMLIRTQRDATLLSARIRAASRKVIGQTDIGGAILYSAASLNANAYEGARRVIDVSGDGSGEAASTALARDYAIAQNIIINGLVIYNEDIDLGVLSNIAIRHHYQEYVIGGNGAFLMVAEDFEDFAISIRRKLVREIFGPNIALLENK
jgi:hypothetical protein